MKFIINKDEIVSIDDKISPNSGSINYYQAEVEFDESWNDLTISAIIVGKERNNEAISVAVIDNKIFIDKKMSGLYGIGFVGYKIEDEIKTYQISTNLAMLSFGDGAGEIEVSNTEEVPEASEWEKYVAQIQAITSEINGLADELNNKVSEVEEKLEHGDFDGKDGITPTIGDNGNWYLGETDTGKPSRGEQGPQGEMGPDGYTPVKGTDYWTNADKAEIESDVIADITPILDEKADKDEIPDVSNFITKDVNNLTNYELKTNTGTNIELSINSSTYEISVSLKNSNGDILNTQSIDLPLETMVIDATYNSQTKEITLILKNGNTISFSVADLISGLQTEITSTNKLLSDLVDDTNQTNKFVTINEKNTWNNKSDFSGNYEDLINKPDIPTVPTNVSAFTNDAGYLTNHQNISGKEDKINKVTSINASSTDEEYPSAKCVYNMIGNIESLLAEV